MPAGLLRLFGSLALAAISACLFIAQKGPELPGFLSTAGYEGTHQIDLDDIAPGYWVKVKRYLSEAEAGYVEAAMMGGKQRVEMNANRQFSDIDTRAGRVELVVQSLHSWNIDEEDGVTVWPLDSGIDTPPKPGVNPYPPVCPRRKSVARLPSPLFDLVWAECDKLNEPRKAAEAAQFPGEPVGSDPDGIAGAA